mgnify:CR=1 FL=1
MEGHEPSYFFFQAEDGIRDVAVTGVQTCALPIWATSTQAVAEIKTVSAKNISLDRKPLSNGTPAMERSEERRVGKECRSRWSP